MLCVTVICTLTICFASPALEVRCEMTHKREFYRKCPEIAVSVIVLIVEDWMWCNDPSPTLGSRAALVLKPASMRLHLVDFHRELFARGSACTICFFIRRWVCWNWDECTLLSTVPSNMCALTLPWHLIATLQDDTRISSKTNSCLPLHKTRCISTLVGPCVGLQL